VTAGAFAASMAARLDATLGSLLSPGRPVALVNFPNHNNPGDNAIWLGAHAVLRRIGVPVGYASNWSTFSQSAMRSAVGDATLLLNGGGNFGDVYAGQQGLREHLLERCTDRRLIQLPQSIWFRQAANVERMRALCASHPSFTMMVRERRSLEFGREALGLHPLLAPDMAFGLGPLERTRRERERHEVLWLGRRASDAEAVARPAPPPHVAVIDWVDAPLDAGFFEAERLVLAENQSLLRLMRENAVDADRWAAPMARTFDGLARAWVRRGIETLCSARVVITDRLHAHVLATQLGLVHVVLDNLNGKVRSTFQTWTGDSGLAHWAETTDEAVVCAEQLLRTAACG
jgi:exopolysaccharide biosynthesis protein PssK